MMREEWLELQLKTLRHELQIADEYRRCTGPKPACSPQLTHLPPSAAGWLRRLCRDALETSEECYATLDAPEEP